MNIIFVGKSAAGKTTIANYLSEKYGYTKAVTSTTRDMRPGEKNNIDYHFLTREEFDNDIKNDKFIEWTEYRGWKYGTPISELDESQKIFVLNPRGLMAFRRKNIQCVAFLIFVDDGERIIRQVKRGDDIKEIERRYETDKQDFYRIEKNVDFIISNNGTVEESAKKIITDINIFSNARN